MSGKKKAIVEPTEQLTKVMEEMEQPCTVTEEPQAMHRSHTRRTATHRICRRDYSNQQKIQKNKNSLLEIRQNTYLQKNQNKQLQNVQKSQNSYV